MRNEASRALRHLCCAILLLTACASQAAPRDIERDGISVRRVIVEYADGVALPSWQASTSMDVAPEVVWSIINDQNRYGEFVPMVVNCRIIRDDPPLRLVSFEVRILWVKVRYTLRLQVHDEVGTVEYRLDKSFPHDIEDTHGRWDVRAERPGGTRVSFAVNINPGRPVPEFLAQRLYRSNTLALMRALRDRARKVAEQE